MKSFTMLWKKVTLDLLKVEKKQFSIELTRLQKIHAYTQLHLTNKKINITLTQFHHLILIMFPPAPKKLVKFTTGLVTKET